MILKNYKFIIVQTSKWITLWIVNVNVNVDTLLDGFLDY
jgi:hypothetical protein